jgi:hypothetical protein
MSLYFWRLGYSVSMLDAVLDATLDGIGMEQLALQMLPAHTGLRLLAASGYPVDMSALEAAAPGAWLSCSNLLRRRC